MDYFVVFLTAFKESFSASEGALIGVIVGAALAGIYNRSLKSIEYRNAYYQKLIERRMAAYEDIRKAVLPFLKILYLDAETKVLSIYFDNTYLEVCENFQSIRYKSVLLGAKSKKTFADLALSVTEISGFLNQPQTPEDLHRLMNFMTEPINGLALTLLRQMEDEYLTLHRLEPYWALVFRRAFSALKRFVKSFYSEALCRLQRLYQRFFSGKKS